MYCFSRPFKCENCGIQYYRKNILKRHALKCNIKSQQKLKLNEGIA
jgi:hypothetical protein